MHPSANTKRWTGHHVAGAFILFFGVIISVNFAMAFLYNLPVFYEVEERTAVTRYRSRGHAKINHECVRPMRPKWETTDKRGSASRVND